MADGAAPNQAGESALAKRAFWGQVWRRTAFTFGLAMALGTVPTFSKAMQSIAAFRPDMSALMLLCIVGASVLGEWMEGATVAFLFTLANLLESYSMERARDAISALLGAAHAMEQAFNAVAALRRPLPDMGRLAQPVPALKSIVTHPPKAGTPMAACAVTVVAT